MTLEATHAGRLPTARVWTVDPLHSSIGFSVKHHAVATYRAGFTEFEGQYDSTTGALTGAARVASVRTFQMLREWLLSPEFLDAESHPAISFASSSVQADGDGLTVEGELTMKGVTRHVRATGTISDVSSVRHHDGTARDHLGMDLGLTIDRREFGLDFNNELLDGRLNLGWDVALEMSLELSAPAAENG